MNPASEDIKDILVADNTLSLTFGTNLFIGKEPETGVADNCVTIFDTPGFGPQLNLNKLEKYDYPSIQIRVRNRSYTDGYDVIDKIKTSLHGIGHETVNSTVYEVIICTTDPAFLDWDGNDRARFVTNFNIQRHN